MDLVVLSISCGVKKSGVGGIGGAVASDDIISFLKIFPKYKNHIIFLVF
jgi:hypothetical protein